MDLKTNATTDQPNAIDGQPTATATTVTVGPITTAVVESKAAKSDDNDAEDDNGEDEDEDDDGYDDDDDDDDEDDQYDQSTANEDDETDEDDDNDRRRFVNRSISETKTAPSVDRYSEQFPPLQINRSTVIGGIGRPSSSSVSAAVAGPSIVDSAYGFRQPSWRTPVPTACPLPDGCRYDGRCCGLSSDRPVSAAVVTGPLIGQTGSTPTVVVDNPIPLPQSTTTTTTTNDDKQSEPDPTAGRRRNGRRLMVASWPNPLRLVLNGMDIMVHVYADGRYEIIACRTDQPVSAAWSADNLTDGPTTSIALLLYAATVPTAVDLTVTTTMAAAGMPMVLAASNASGRSEWTLRPMDAMAAIEARLLYVDDDRSVRRNRRNDTAVTDRPASTMISADGLTIHVRINTDRRPQRLRRRPGPRLPTVPTNVRLPRPIIPTAVPVSTTAAGNNRLPVNIDDSKRLPTNTGTTNNSNQPSTVRQTDALGAFRGIGRAFGGLLDAIGAAASAMALPSMPTIPSIATPDDDDSDFDGSTITRSSSSDAIPPFERFRFPTADSSVPSSFPTVRLTPRLTFPTVERISSERRSVRPVGMPVSYTSSSSSNTVPPFTHMPPSTTRMQSMPAIPPFQSIQPMPPIQPIRPVQSSWSIDDGRRTGSKRRRPNPRRRRPLSSSRSVSPSLS